MGVGGTGQGKGERIHLYLCYIDEFHLAIYAKLKRSVTPTSFYPQLKDAEMMSSPLWLYMPHIATVIIIVKNKLQSEQEC